MLRSLGLALLLSTLTASAAGAATLSPIGTFDQPILITSDPSDSSRVFVVERPGRVAEVTDSGIEPYADLTEYVACCSSERGLLSISPAPDFHESGLFYASYTGKPLAGGPPAGGAEGDIHVDAFVADADAKVTRTPIVSAGHSQQGNHNGGQIQFGPDGYLYISTGDGGGGGDPFETGQNLDSLLGKVLRVDPHPGSIPAYSVPSGNPFVGSIPGEDEIWAYGLRNPWRFSFDSLTGDMVIGDVGQGLREEVDVARSLSDGVVGGVGANYGWSCREGFIAYPNDGTPTMNCPVVPNFTDPVFDYPHTNPGGGVAYGCSITGGYVARDPTLGDLYGRYVYADFCTKEIRSLALPAGATPAADRSEGIVLAAGPTSFGEDSCHRLYVASGSTVFRFEGAMVPECPQPPVEEPPDEEPPGEEEPPPPGDGEPSPPADSQTPNPLVRTPPPVPAPTSVSLEAADLGDGDYRLRVQASPCSPSDTDSIQLNRGGHRLQAKPANAACAARFHVHVERRATFRAIFRVSADAAPARSNRVGL